MPQLAMYPHHSQTTGPHNAGLPAPFRRRDIRHRRTRFPFDHPLRLLLVYNQLYAIQRFTVLGVFSANGQTIANLPSAGAALRLAFLPFLTEVRCGLIDRRRICHFSSPAKAGCLRRRAITAQWIGWRAGRHCPARFGGVPLLRNRTGCPCRRWRNTAHMAGSHH